MKLLVLWVWCRFFFFLFRTACGAILLVTHIFVWVSGGSFVLPSATVPRAVLYCPVCTEYGDHVWVDIGAAASMDAMEHPLEANRGTRAREKRQVCLIGETQGAQACKG